VEFVHEPGALELGESGTQRLARQASNASTEAEDNEAR
jgi:hypothetical protein